jgi:hypothetical protein
MEKIEPLADHLLLSRIATGNEVKFIGKPYRVLSRTTLASGEPALVLQDEEKQFVIGASRLLAGLEKSE